MGSAPPPHPHPFRTLLKCPSKNLDIIESDLITKAKIWKVYDWSLDARTIANEKRVYIISVTTRVMFVFLLCRPLNSARKLIKKRKRKKSSSMNASKNWVRTSFFLLHFLSALYELYHRSVQT